MKATRRSFFGYMLGAPAAARASIEQLVPDAIKSVSYQSLSGEMCSSVPSAPYAGHEYGGKFNIAEQLANLRKRLNSVDAEISPLDIFIQQVTRFDGDIASMRSLSITAKIRMQAVRNRTAVVERETGWLEQAIADLLGRKANR